MIKSADVNDNASELEDQFRDAAIKDARRTERVPSDFDGSNCYECGDALSEQRLALHAWMCVECKTAQEKRNKLFRR